MLAWRKGFYGNVIAGSAFVAHLLLGGSYYAFSVLAPLMANDLGWSATAFGAAFSIFALVAGLSSPLAGTLVHRFGPRTILMAGALMEAVVLLLLAQSTTIWQLYLSVTLLALGDNMSAIFAVQQLVGNWFVVRRSQFMGMVLTGAGFGGLVITSLSGGLVNVLGSWRPVWLVLAGMVLLPGVLALLFVRDRPEDLGQEPDGITHAAQHRPGAPATGRVNRVYRTARQWKAGSAIRTRTFWIAALATGVMFFLVQAVTAHQVAYLSGEGGVDLAIAASALGLIAGSSILGRVIAGWLGDRIEPRYLMAGLLLMMALALPILLMGQELATLYIYVLLFGMGYGGVIVLGPTLMLNYFGAKSYATVMGIAVPIGTVLGALSPLLIGAIKDASGSYVPGFVLMMAIAVVGAILAFLARPPAVEKDTVAES